MIPSYSKIYLGLADADKTENRTGKKKHEDS